MNINLKRIVIPAVALGTSATTIATVFKTLRLATIKRIALFRNKKHYIAYIEVDKWYDNVASVNFRIRMLDQKTVPIVYDDPKIWKVSFDREPKRKFPKNSIQVFLPKTQDPDIQSYVIDILDEEEVEDVDEMDLYLQEIDKVRSDYSPETIGKYYPVICNAV
jgi:hypothetical protein